MKDNWAAVHMGFNVFDSDEGVRIQRIDDLTAWRPLGCQCDNTPPVRSEHAEWNFKPCPECKKAGFKTNMCDDEMQAPAFNDDAEATAWVLDNARKNKVCRKAVKLVYGI